MDTFKKGWFSEQSEGWPGLVQSYEVEEVLHTEKSKFQDIVVAKTKRCGLMMSLDGAVQTTELDEFAYQEMLAHLPLYAHPNPKDVLIIGGGDLGVAREVLRHKCVEKVVLCDIDERVTVLSKQYLPHLAEAASKDSRLTVLHGDGCAFVQEHKNAFDVVITDSSDPIGPAESLFGEKYYKGVFECLREGGIAVSQGENFWLDAKFIIELRDCCKKVGFGDVEYAVIQIPTYPCGSIGAFVASRGGSCKTTRREITAEEQKQLRYYNKAIHSSSFVLPEFFRKMFEVEQK
jgi:spermidine synthase